jgi:hypothetical protein
MKKIIKTLIILLVLLSVSDVYAQQGQFYQFILLKETKVLGSNIFYAGLTNNGDEKQIDVNQYVKDQVNFFLKTYSGNAEKKIQNHISWTTNPLFQMVNDANEADVVIAGYYTIKTGSLVEEKLFYERQTNVGGAIPFYEIRQTNSASIQIVISYTYKDKTVDYDTITISNQYERKPNTTYKSIDDLLKKAESDLKMQLYKCFTFYKPNHIWYKFLPVKTKDKALKEELKNASVLLENGEIEKLGNLYKRIYQLETDNKEAAFNLGLCYELVGNYDKAEQYFAIMPDFHVNVRMKENRILFDYLKSIGVNMVIKDFE